MTSSQCKHERNQRSCQWCSEDPQSKSHSSRTHGELGLSRRRLASLSVDARQAYATQNGREWPKIDRYQEEMTDWHNRHLEQFGDPDPGEDFDPYW